jgi:hypothetical protein
MEMITFLAGLFNVRGQCTRQARDHAARRAASAHHAQGTQDAPPPHPPLPYRVITMPKHRTKLTAVQ